MNYGWIVGQCDAALKVFTYAQYIYLDIYDGRTVKTPDRLC